jgi:aldehyde dehydrogenase
MSIPSTTAEAMTRVEVKPRYDNFIGGKFQPPVRGNYFSNPSPITGKPLCEVARSTA